MRKKNLLYVVLLTTGLLANKPSTAAQSESPVPCIEGAEPLTLVYGDHTSGCSISASARMRLSSAGRPALGERPPVAHPRTPPRRSLSRAPTGGPAPIGTVS